jgi:hypothetical protein
MVKTCTLPKSNRSVAKKRGKIETSNTHIHDSSLFWSGTGTKNLINIIVTYLLSGYRGVYGCDRMVVGFTTIYAISVLITTTYMIAHYSGLVQALKTCGFN